MAPTTSSSGEPWQARPRVILALVLVAVLVILGGFLALRSAGDGQFLMDLGTECEVTLTYDPVLVPDVVGRPGVWRVMPTSEVEIAPVDHGSADGREVIHVMERSAELATSEDLGDRIVVVPDRLRPALDGLSRTDGSIVLRVSVG